MRSTRTGQMLLGLLAVLLLTGLGSPAQAETKTRSDPHGDNFGGRAWDLTRFTATNGARRFTLQFQLATLQPKRLVTAQADLKYDRAFALYYTVTTLRRPNGDVVTRLWKAGDEPYEQNRVKCSVKATWGGVDARTIKVVIPQRCLPNRLSVGLRPSVGRRPFSQDSRDGVAFPRVRRG